MTSETNASTPPAIGAPSAGLRYQVRFFWRKALPLLYKNEPVKVVLEHRGVDAVDDVVVYYASPGVNDEASGTKITADFHQLKFHLALTGAVDGQVVLDPDWTGTKVSLLKRFCEAWKGIRGEHPNARLFLVTNWPWDPKCPLAPLLRDGRLSDAFFTKGRGSKVGKIRAKWKVESGLSDDDFKAFVRALRFSTSAVSQAEADAWLGDCCHAAGLQPPDPTVEWSAYDDLGHRLIESGRIEHTHASLRALLDEQKLVATKTPPFKSTFIVRSFKPFAHAGADGAIVTDLTELFADRRPIDEHAWSGEIRRRLDESIPAIGALGQPVELVLDAHLSISWYAGHLLNPKSGVPVVLRQRIRNKGIQLWDVSQPRRPAGAAEWTPALEKVGDGSDLAIVVSVTHDALADAKRHIATVSAIGNVLHVKVPQPGSYAVQDGGHVRWLAEELVRIARGPISTLRPGRVHLFPACPGSLAFLLGQEAAVLGPTTVYEHAFGDPSRAYLPGMST